MTSAVMPVTTIVAPRPTCAALATEQRFVFVNGRRQPLAGSDADFVDTSNIPWSAVERIEILPDGASARIWLRCNRRSGEHRDARGHRGAETQARLGSALGGPDEKMFAQLFGRRWDTGKWLFSYQYSERGSLAAADRRYTSNADKRPLGGTDHRSLMDNPGNIIDPSTFALLAIPSGQDGTHLSVGNLLEGRVNRSNFYESYELMPQRLMHSVFANVSQQIGGRVELFAEARMTQRKSRQRLRPHDDLIEVPEVNPFNPYDAGSVLVAYSFLNDLGPVTYAGSTRSFDGAVGLRVERWGMSGAPTYSPRMDRKACTGQSPTFRTTRH